MSSETTPPERDPLAEAYPPLDAGESRWWYWIAAYLLATVLFVPLVLVAGVALFAPAVVAGPGTGPAVRTPLAFVLLLVMLLVFGFAILAFVVFVMLPVALYMDARHVARSGLDWEPDPVLYGVLGLLQFVVTPLIGFFVAVYYLYQRHEHVGVP